jgi:hypothetical protein
MSHGGTLNGVLRGSGVVVNNLKRFTICKVAGHAWVKVRYPSGSDGEAAGTFLRCHRCGKEDHEAGTHARGGGGAF